MWWLLMMILRFPLPALHAGRGGGMVFPATLSREEEEKLFREMESGDAARRQKARSALIEHNLRLVSHIVGKYARMGLGDDLFSIGCIGLIKAADTFSPEKKIRFSSYAAKCVQNEILMVLRAGKKSARDVSLSDPIESDRDGNPLTVGDLIADDQDLPALIDRRLDAEKLAALVAGLLARERQVVRMRYGLSGGAPLTQQEIARKLGISRSYVSRIEKKAIASLREGFGE